MTLAIPSNCRIINGRIISCNCGAATTLVAIEKMLWTAEPAPTYLQTTGRNSEDRGSQASRLDIWWGYEGLYALLQCANRTCFIVRAVNGESAKERTITRSGLI